MKYKHDEVIRAWLDGKTVQFRFNDEWKDFECVNATEYVPYFYVGNEYRIKPEPKPDVVRFVSVYKDGGTSGSYENINNKNVSVSSLLGIIKYTIDGETGKLKSAEVV